MSTFTDKWRSRRRAARNQREFYRAVDRAGSPAMREELLALAAREGNLFR